MNKKIFFLFTIIVCIGVCLFAMTGCAEKSVPSDLYIVAEDVENVPAGEYNLIYSINNMKKYEAKYGLSVSVSAYMLPNNTPISVSNNRVITVESEKSYAIAVRVNGILNGENFSIAKSFTVKAAYSARTVVFMYDEDYIIKTLTVPYGAALSAEEIPELPDIYTTSGTGYRTEIAEKYWALCDAENKEIKADNAKLVELLNNITEDIPVYAVYEYNIIALDFTITFETNGGSDVADYVGNINTVVSKPDNPNRTGYVFAGWCTDEELTEYYNWKRNATLESDMTLYAKWFKVVEGTSDVHFTYTKKTDDNGNECYYISAKDRNNLVGDIVLPNEYNGLPVTGMTESAFENTEITSVVIPNSYSLGDCERAFMNCKKLQKVTFTEGNESTRIATMMFCQCYELKSVAFPDAIEAIEDEAFENCLKLAYITLPDELKCIYSKAFAGCKGINELILPTSMEIIFAEAFSDCTSLTTVELNANLSGISERTFAGCTALKTLVVPEKSNLQYVGDNAFEGSALTEVEVAEDFQYKDIFEQFGLSIRLY